MKNWNLVLRLFFLIIFTYSANSVFGQIFSENFDSGSSPYGFSSISGGTPYTGSSGTTDRPASTTFYNSTNTAYGFSGASGNSVLTSGSINTSNYTGIQLTFRVAAWSIGSTGNGMDGTDKVSVEVSPDGGTNWYNTIEVVGNSNAYWHYNTGTGIATTAYDGNATPQSFAPGGGGNRTTDGYSTVTITSLPSVANMKFRVTLLDNTTSERWTIDDFELTGTPSSAASVTHTGITPATANIQQASTNNVLYQVQVDVSTAAATLTSLVATTGGDWANGDISNLKLWFSTDASFGGDATIATVTNPNPGDVTFTISNQAFPIGTRYLFITCDVAASATIGKTVSARPDADGDFTYSVTPTYSGSTFATANAMTIVGVPEIQLQYPIATDVACGFTLPFGSVAVGTNSSLTVKVKNLGTADLTFTLSSITGTGAADYSITTPPTSPIAAGGFSDMVIQFAPSVAGSRPAAISISSNDSDEPSCGVTITGTGLLANDNCSGATSLTAYSTPTCGGSTSGTTVGATNSSVTGCAGTADDDVWYSFVATSTSHTITVVGAGSLDPVVNLRSGACNGASVACADVTGDAGTEVIDATGLTIGATYLIRVYGYYSGTGYGTFTICVTTPPPPAITHTGTSPAASNIQQSSTNNVLYSTQVTVATTAATLSQVIATTSGTWATGDVTNFKLWFSTDASFGGDATIATVSSPNPGDLTFTVGNQAFPIGTRYLFITCDVAGNATINNTVGAFVDNDADFTYSPSPNFSGSTFASANLKTIVGIPEIQLESPVNTPIACGASPLSLGSVSIGSSSTITVRIRNSGTADLNLTSLPLSLAGTNPGDYSITTQPTSPITPGSFSDIVVQFSPTSTGTRSATISIANDDPNGSENPCAVLLTGTGLAPEIQLKQQPAGTNRACGFTFDMGTVNVGSTASLTVRIQNTATTNGAPLNLTNLPLTITGTNASEFSITSQPTSPIAASNAFSDVVIQFAPTSNGPKTAAISIGNNDTDENPCGINLSGTGFQALYFQSKQNGDWATASTWEVSTVSANGPWSNATSVPSLSDLTTTIKNNHTVTINSSVTLDETVVESNGSLVITSAGTLTISNGTGTDLSVSGILKLAGTFTNNGTVVIENGGKYQHNYTSLTTIPTCMWSAGSTCEIIGYTSTSGTQSGVGQIFHNFIWNCTSQSGNTNLAGLLTTVGGDFEVSSTGSGSLRLTGSTQLTIDIAGNLIITGGLLDMSSGGSQTILNLAGNFDMNGGTLTESSSGNGTVVFNGSTQYYYKTGGTISNTINFKINSGSTTDFGTNVIDGGNGTFTLNAGGSIKTANSNGIAGTITSTGIKTFNSGANYEFQGPTTGTFPVASVNNLTFNRSGTIVLEQSFTVTGTASVTSGTTIDCGSTSVLSGSGSFSLLDASTFITANAAGINSTGFNGSIQTSTRSFNAGANYEFQGANTGSFGTAVNNLTINSGGTILSQGLTVNGILNLTSGTLNLNGKSLTVNNINGASSSNYIIADGNGSSLIKSNPSSFTFPIGTTVYYMPCTLTGSGTAQVSLSPLASGLTNSDYALLNQWNITGLSPLISSATFAWAGGQGTNFPSGGTNLYLFRSDAGTWTQVGGPVTTSGTASFTNVPCCSGFTIGGEQALPVELINFDAKLEQRQVMLQWETATEINNSHFSIEKSTDGKNFKEIGTVEGKGTSYTINDYNFTDESPVNGLNYYRLRQVDFDGNFEYSKMVSVDFGSRNEVLVYPTITTESIKIRVSNPSENGVSIEVINSNGLLLKSAQIPPENSELDLDISGIPSGTYFIRIQNEQLIETLRFIRV